LQLRVRQRFEELSKADQKEGRVPWHFVSAAQTVEEVQADIYKIVEKTLEVKNGKELGKLWEEGTYQLTTKPTEKDDKTDMESGKENERSNYSS
jgi:hypothetical protein